MRRVTLRSLVAGGLIALSAALAATARPHAPTGKSLDCAFASAPDSEVTRVESCAWEDSQGRVHLRETHLRRLTFDRHGLATVGIVGQWWYARRDGRMAPVMTMDNWAEDFSNGLARSPVGGKIGYIDRSLRLVIPARYNGAYRFKDGFAAVCVGCRLETHGEYHSYGGGQWGCIDRRGRAVGPFKPSPTATPPDCPRWAGRR